MKKYLILIILGLSISSIQAQVGGLSASKLGTLSTSVVPEGTIEFEPFFGYSLSTHYFNEFGDRKSLYASTDTTLIFESRFESGNLHKAT